MPLVNGFKKKNLGATSDDLVAGADESLSVIARCAAIGHPAAAACNTLNLPWTARRPACPSPALSMSRACRTVRHRL